MMINKDFNTILELLQAFPDEQSCIDHLEKLRWNNNVVSPFDASSTVYNCAGNKYKCKNTGKYFNVKTATLFDNTKIGLQKWFLAIWLVTSHKKGISSMQLAKDIGVTQKTAWFMLHRIRNCFGANDEKMDGIVQADETYVGGKLANKHKKDRVKKHKDGVVTGMVEKTAVFGMLENDNTVRAQMITSPSKRTIQPLLGSSIKKGATVVTDGFGGYAGIGKYFNDHIIVDHGKNEFTNGGFHTNSLEGFWSLLKRGILGIYHHVSPKHIDMYLKEFSFRYNTRKTTEQLRFNTMLSNTGHRLTYKELING